MLLLGPVTEIWILPSKFTWVWVCVFGRNRNLSSLVLAGQMFSTTGACADGSWVLSLAYTVYLWFVCFLYLKYLTIFGALVFILKALDRKVWKSFSLLFSLLTLPGSWFWPHVLWTCWSSCLIPPQMHKQTLITFSTFQLSEWNSWLLQTWWIWA